MTEYINVDLAIEELESKIAPDESGYLPIGLD
jgi:hypothetical protein